VRGRLAALVLAAGALAPETSHACAVCFSGADGARVAFLLTTALLTLLPLALLGGFAWWLRRRIRELDSEARGDVPVETPRAP
jgi:hypothetical protein